MNIPAEVDIMNKEEFMERAGINNSQRFYQLISGHKQKVAGTIYIYDPVLTEGEDYIKIDYIFFPSALQKIKALKERAVVNVTPKLGASTKYSKQLKGRH